MNERIKALWLTALRSGEYKQFKGALKGLDETTEEIGYCCLGVLCDIYSKETGEGDWSDFAFSTEKDYRGGCLPVEVAEWAGVTPWGSPLWGPNLNLPSLNDEGAPFSEIAEVIERKL